MTYRAPPGYITADEAAERLYVSRATIYAWISRGYIAAARNGRERLPGQRVRGGAIRIPESEVERMLTAA